MAPPRWLTAVTLSIACVWVVDLAVLRGGTPDPLDDTWEYGVAARALAAGQGFRTTMLHPPLWHMHDAAFTVPVLIHGPVLPVLLLPIVTSMPAAIDQVAWIAALFATAAAVWTGRLAARRYGVPAGVAAALAFTAAPPVIHAVHHDLSPLVGALLFVAALDLVTRPRPRALACGLVLGVGWLVRPEFLLVAPLVAVLAPGRARAALAAGFLVPALPWAVHNLQATGSPIFNLSSYLVIGYTPERPGLSELSDFSLTPDRWPQVLRAALPHLPHKWLLACPHAIKRMLSAPSGSTGWVAVIGAISALATRETRRDAVVALAIAAVPFAVLVLTVYNERYVVPFMPLWAIAAARGAQVLAARLPPWGRTARMPAALLLLLVIPASLPAMVADAGVARALRERIARERAQLAARPAPPRPLMFSDTPDFVGWTTGRATLWITPAQYQQLAPCMGREAPGPAPPCRDGPEETWFHRPDGSVQ